MYGSLASVATDGSGSSPAASSAGPHSTSRPSVHGTSRDAIPNRRTTRHRSTVGASASAASATDFMSTTFPRRQKPSAVTSSFASQSASRLATAGAPYPEKMGV